jgi:hypothetical protein
MQAFSPRRSVKISERFLTCLCNKVVGSLTSSVVFMIITSGILRDTRTVMFNTSDKEEGEGLYCERQKRTFFTTCYFKSKEIHILITLKLLS